MVAGGEEYKLESKAFLLKEEKRKAKKALIVSMEPHDRFNIVYCIMVVQGVGTLLPWNMFITAHAYFQEKLQKNKDLTHSFENYFSIAAMVPNVLVFLLNTLFKHRICLQVRMLTSVCIMTLCFVLTTVLVIIDTSNWTNQFFVITILTIVIVNMCCAVYQGGLFGLSGMMPQRYTGAVMTGQGIGGIFAALASIASIFGGKTPESSGFGYFLSAACVLMLCIVSYVVLHRLKFVRHYISSPHEEKLQTSLDEDALLSENNGVAFVNETECPPFVLVFKQIAKLGLSVAFVFFVTLAAFPSLTSRITSVNKDDKSLWTSTCFVPVTCFLLFNVGDFGGRLAASFIQWPGKDGKLLPLLCFLRIIFLPLFAFCNAQPRNNSKTIFNEDYFPIIFMALFAISNGYLGSLCMMYGPTLVEARHAETAGTMMAFLLIVGLGLGAAFSFVITMNL